MKKIHAMIMALIASTLSMSMLGQVIPSAQAYFVENCDYVCQITKFCEDNGPEACAKLDVKDWQTPGPPTDFSKWQTPGPPTDFSKWTLP